jgi:hypothetical protein
VRGAASFMENFEAANIPSSASSLIQFWYVFWMLSILEGFPEHLALRQMLIYARCHSAGPRFSQTLTTTHSPH